MVQTPKLHVLRVLHSTGAMTRTHKAFAASARVGLSIWRLHDLLYGYAFDAVHAQLHVQLSATDAVLR